jgi:hypothetical protein
MVHIRADFDAACRKALLDGVPAPLLPKMVEALSAQVTPNTRRAQREARRYFGKEADEIFAHAATFAQDLHQFLADRFGLLGLIDWLTATGYGNDYRMIKVFAEWARLSSGFGKQKIILPNG